MYKSYHEDRLLKHRLISHQCFLHSEKWFGLMMGIIFSCVSFLLYYYGEESLFCSEAFWEASLILSYCFCFGFLTHISIPFIASMYWIQIANFLHFFVLKVLLYSSFQKNLCIRQHMYIYTYINTKEPIGTESEILGNTTAIRSSACRLKL